MKRNRSESLASSSSSGDNSSDSDTSTISSHDSSGSEERSPKPNCVESNNQTSSNKSKQGSSTSSSNSSKRTASSMVTSQTKRSQCSSDKNAQQISQTVSKKIKNGNASYASPTKGSKAALPKKKQIIEVIDSSTSGYSPSDDEDGTESSSSSESEEDTQKEKKAAYKKIKHKKTDQVKKAFPVLKKAKDENLNDKEINSGTQRRTRKEPFSREEDEAIIAMYEKAIRPVDLAEHLQAILPEYNRHVDTVRQHRNCLFHKWKQLILGSDHVNKS